MRRAGPKDQLARLTSVTNAILLKVTNWGVRANGKDLRMETKTNVSVSLAEAAYAAALLDMRGSYSITRPRKRANAPYAAHLVVTTGNAILACFMQHTFKAKIFRRGLTYRIYWNYEQMENLLRPSFRI